MLNWLNRLAPLTKSSAEPRTPQCRKAARTRLALETLEEREVPALTIQFDFSYDTNGFFNDASRRSTLQLAANELAARIDPGLAAITPGGGNTWTSSFYNPATGGLVSTSNLSIAADTIVIYVGGRDLNGTEAGVGGFGGYSASGTSSWVNFLSNRGRGGAAPWGGSMSFDTNGTPWYFGASSSIPTNTVDFYSVAQHEIGHVLGIGTSNSWFSQISGGTFNGANAKALYGSPVPVQSGGGHWADGIKGFGCSCPSCAGVASAVTNQPSMDPSTPYATRIGMSELDYAALKDLGWGVVSAAAAYSKPVSPPPVVNPTPVSSKGEWVAISGGLGQVQIFQQGSNGGMQAITGVLTPFAGYGGTIRSAVGDFNGDGIQDVAVGTGGGISARVLIYNGRDFSLLVGPTTVLGGFGGGVFLAAGDVDKDGNDELAIGADYGSGRINVLDYRSGQLVTICDMFAFEAPTFVGGARVALGDVNKDGYADLVVTAGPGGGPRVSTYSGKSVMYGGNARLFNDFFAFDPNLRTGAYVSAADLNGDGYAEIIFSADTGGSSRAIAYSGALLTAAPPGTDPMKLPLLFSQYTTPENLPYGTRVTVKDLDGDGRNEMIFTTARRTDSTIRIITSAQILSGTQPTNQVQQPLGPVWDLLGLYVG